jgi:HlyD family secretion protein
LDKLARAINVIDSTSILADTLTGYRNNVSTARTEVSVAISGLQTAKQNILSAQSKLDLSLKQYGLKNAPPTKEEVVNLEAQVEQAQAQADQILAQISKNKIISPIEGIVTRQDAKEGETGSVNLNVVTVMSDGSFEIEANVPEVDVGKLSLGNKVSISLDAYPGAIWTGKVSYIEPAETIVDGVVNYKIKVVFDNSDSRLKSGLTANLKIETVRKENVLVLPQYSIVENDKGSFVNKFVDKDETEEVSVKTGIRGQDGRVEIISGLKEGDMVENSGLK